MADAPANGAPGERPPPCCPVGAREDAAAIAAALRAVGRPGAESMSAIATRLGLAKSSVHRHRTRCLGVAGDQVEDVPVQATAERFGTPGERAGTPPLGGPPRALALAPSAPLPQTVERVRHITNTAAIGEWRGTPTLEAMARVWGCDRATVIEYARLAGFDAGREAGPVELLVINSIGVNRSIRDDAKAACKQSRQMAADAIARARALERDADDAKEPIDKATLLDVALAERRIAIQAHRTADNSLKIALVAQRQADVLSGLFAPSGALAVTVSVRANDDFGQVWSVVQRVLEARYPGAAAVVERALGVWEAGGDEALRRLLGADAEGVVDLERGGDGTYG